VAAPAFRASGAPAKSPDAFRTISEVATDLDVPQHVLRFWESRFAQIKPVKRAELLEQIDKLLRGVAAGHSLAESAEPASVPDDTRPLRILLAEDARRMIVREAGDQLGDPVAQLQREVRRRRAHQLAHVLDPDVVGGGAALWRLGLAHG